MKKSWRFYRVNLYSIYSHGAPSGNNALQTLNMSTMCQVASSHWGVPFVQAFTKDTVLVNNAMRAANISGDLSTSVSTDRHCILSGRIPLRRGSMKVRPCKKDYKKRHSSLRVP